MVDAQMMLGLVQRDRLNISGSDGDQHQDSSDFALRGFFSALLLGSSCILLSDSGAFFSWIGSSTPNLTRLRASSSRRVRSSPMRYGLSPWCWRNTRYFMPHLQRRASRSPPLIHQLGARRLQGFDPGYEVVPLGLGRESVSARGPFCSVRTVGTRWPLRAFWAFWTLRSFWTRSQLHICNALLTVVETLGGDWGSP